MAPGAARHAHAKTFGADSSGVAASILATEHWSLLATRSLIWNEAMSRATVFLTVLSASIVALALMADATGFGPQTTTLVLVLLPLVLLPLVLLLGIATYVRLVQINTEEFQLVLAMNRLRRGYLTIAPGLEPYFTTGHHDDEHMFTAAATMAKASMAPEVAASLDTPPQQLRSAFAMLLGEHMVLVVDAQRATFAGSGEFKAAAEQVNANTAAMTKGMAGIVGPRKAAEFQAGWAEHVEGLMAYTAAVADKDEAAKAAAKQRLDHVVVALAVYLSGILRNKSAYVPLAGAISTHDQQLMDQIDAYAAGSYDRAQQLQLQGDAHIFQIADTLVDGIQRAVHGQLPVGGSQTGGGGTAHPSR